MDNSPSGLFDSYEQDFQHIIESVRDKLEGKGKDEQGEARKASLRRVEMDLDEAEEMVSQMEIEIQGIPQSVRSQFSGRLKAAKTELSRFKKLSKDLHSQLARADLMHSNNDSFNSDDPYGTASDRTRLLAGTQVLEDGSRRLQDSQRIALETESQGAEILMNLRQQRETIENSANMLHTADTAIDRASGTLKTMIRRMYQQRVVTAAIIIVLILLIGVILWEKLA